MSNNKTTSREKGITRTSVVGIVTNVLLAGFKALVGAIAGSVSILMDAVNNLSDALSSVITIVGIRLARRRPDRNHPFGYGRIEYFSAIIIAGLVFAAGVTSLIESVKKIIHPEVADYTAVTITVVCVAIVTKLLLGRYVKRQGKRFDSDALVASGSDATFDALISASTLVGAAVTLIWGISIDGFIGVLIAAFIIKAGIEMLGRPLSEVLGTRPVGEVTTSIKADVCSVPGVRGAFDLVLHNYGPEYALGSVHVEVADNLTAEEVGSITKEVQRVVLERHSLFLTVGIYAVHAEETPMTATIRKEAMAIEGFKSIHGLFVDERTHTISFDVVSDFKVDRSALRNQLKERLKTLFPDYTAEIGLDVDYSD